MKIKSSDEKFDWYFDVRSSAKQQVVHRPKLLPNSIDEAYAIQASLIHRLKQQVSGWKLGGTNSKTIEAFGCNELYFGPLFSSKTFMNRLNVDVDDLLEIKGEVELVFKLSQEMDLFQEGTTIDVDALVEGVALGVEMPSSCFSDVKEGGLNLLIADLCGTGALVLGDFQAISNFSELQNIKISMFQKDALLTQGNTSNILPDQYKVLHKFFELARRYNVVLRAGQFISTGGSTSCEGFCINEEVRVEAEGFKDLRFVPRPNLKSISL